MRAIRFALCKFRPTTKLAQPWCLVRTSACTTQPLPAMWHQQSKRPKGYHCDGSGLPKAPPPSCSVKPYPIGALYRSTIVRNRVVCLVVVAAVLASCGGAGGPSTAGNPASPTRLGPSPASSARLQSPPVGSPSPSPAVSADPELLSNTNGSFAFRHPPSWKFTNCENFAYAIWFGTADNVGCAGESSGYFAIIVLSVPGDQRSAPSQGNYIHVGTVDQAAAVQVSGIEGVRTTAHLDSNPGMGPEAGTTQLLYDVYNGARTYFALYQHRPTEPDNSSAFDDLMQHSFKFAPWNGYRSDKWGYTVDYPASWYDLSNLGAPDTEEYFANEQSIGSPVGMDSQGVFFALNIETGSCRAAPPGNVDATTQLTVDGQTVTRISGFLGPPQSEVYWSSFASIPKTTSCFGFAFIFGSKAARDADLQITDQIISSFTTSN
jgi:hypothetical protein